MFHDSSRTIVSLKRSQEKEAGNNWFPNEHMEMTSQMISSYLLDRGRKSTGDPISETDL